jgi:signal transduction histidine kinase
MFWLEVGAHTLAHWVILAVFVALAIYMASLFFRKKEFFVWAEAVAFCFFSPIFFLHPRATFKLAFAMTAALLFVVLFFSPVLLFRRAGDRADRRIGGYMDGRCARSDGRSAGQPVRRSECRSERRGERVALGRASRAEGSSVKVENGEFSRYVPPMPVFMGAREVQLGYAFEVLRKLRKAKLNERDRMETDVIQNMLTVYSAKERLSTEEAHTLNGYLASLLKLMAAYSV